MVREVHTAVSPLLVLLAMVPLIKWVRVAQREHYLSGRMLIFVRLWYRDSFGSLLGALVAVLAMVLAAATGLALTAKLIAAGLGVGAALLLPLGLTLRGRTAKLALTARARRLIVVSLALDAVAAAALSVVGMGLAAGVLLGLAAPLVVEAGLRITAPLEARMMSRFVEQATSTLKRVRPRVVAITGSYGKTTTKNYTTALLEGSYQAVASPASFNNRGGLARTINEHLLPGTDVFIAEMGTFGPGEIASLCEWIPPEIAVLTALGPVHLERFGSEAEILRAKLEITTAAQVVIVNVDIPRLALAAKMLTNAGGKRVVPVSAISLDADVLVKPNDEGELVIYTGGSKLARVPANDLAATNLACAIAVALEVGVEPAQIVERVANLKSPANRLVAGLLPESGVEVLDDTYNSNPSGARRALDALIRRGEPGCRRVVVTPGMVELGRQQYPENFRFAKAVGMSASHLVIVGRTNRQALEDGAHEALETPGHLLEGVARVANRAEALAWVRKSATAGDVVLYENDLPDHYP